MIFCQADFIVFFLIVWCVAWICRQHALRKVWLLLTSYFFYGYWDWRFCFLLLVVTLLSYWFGAKIEQARNFGARKNYLIVAVSSLLGFLFLFKYYNFFTNSIVSLLGSIQLSWPTLNLILPLGISFYVFRCISYVVDVYKQKIYSCPSILDFSLFIAFFPCLIQGPITRADSFLPQLQKVPNFSTIAQLWGLRLFVIGAFKKVFIADRLGVFVDEVFNFQLQYSAFTLVLAALAYTVQILCDFSGYSDMAIGIAKLLGYQVHLNFDSPYIATNISDFWRRWHISLSTWLRDYLYIPLGGNRKGKFRTAGNQMVTMLLGGLWHGANWNFVIWGGWHGLCLAVHKEFRSYMKTRKQFQSVFLVNKVLAWALTMLSVVFGWVFFRANTLKDACSFIQRMLCNKSGYIWIEPFVPFAILLLIGQNIVVNNKYCRRLFYPRLGSVFYWWFLLTLIALTLIFRPTHAAPFIYFQF